MQDLLQGTGSSDTMLCQIAIVVSIRAHGESIESIIVLPVLADKMMLSLFSARPLQQPITRIASCCRR